MPKLEPLEMGAAHVHPFRQPTTHSKSKQTPSPTSALMPNHSQHTKPLAFAVPNLDNVPRAQKAADA